MTRQEAMDIREALVRATHVRQKDGFGPNTRADLDFAIGVLKRFDDEALAEDVAVVPYPRDGSRDGDPWENERQHRENARPGNVTLGANRPEGGPSNMTVDDYLAMQRGAKPASGTPIADGLANGTYRLAEAMARLEEAIRDSDNNRAKLWAHIHTIEAEGKGEPDRPGIDRLARLEEIVNRLDGQAEKAWNAYEPLKAEMARFEGRLTRIGELVDDGIAKLIIAAGERLDTHAKAIGELNDANASLVAQVAALTMKSNEIPPIKDPEARERIEELEHLGSEVRAVLEKRLDRLESGGPLANKSEEALSTAQRLAGLVGQTSLKGTLCERVAELERRMDLDQGPVDLPNPLNLAGEPVAKVDPRDAIGDKQDETHGSIPVAEALPELRWKETSPSATDSRGSNEEPPKQGPVQTCPPPTAKTRGKAREELVSQQQVDDLADLVIRTAPGSMYRNVVESLESLLTLRYAQKHEKDIDEARRATGVEPVIDVSAERDLVIKEAKARRDKRQEAVETEANRLVPRR